MAIEQGTRGPAKFQQRKECNLNRQLSHRIFWQVPSFTHYSYYTCGLPMQYLMVVVFLWFEIVKMSLRVLILFNVCMCTSWVYDVITLVFSKKERRHKSYKMCIVDKSFIQLQFHEANTLIVQFFGQLTKGFFYYLKILTLSCFRRHKDLKLLLNLLAETSGVPQFFCNCICWPKRSWWYIRGDIYA